MTRDNQDQTGGTLSGDQNDANPGPALLAVGSDRWESLVERINVRASDLLAQRRERGTAVSVLSDWRRPVLSASVLLAAAAVVALVMVPPQEVEAELAVAESLVPISIAAWLDADVAPTMTELLLDVEGYVP